MTRLIGANTNPGANWAPRIEALTSGGVGFEVASGPEWPTSRWFGTSDQTVWTRASWGGRLGPKRGVHTVAPMSFTTGSACSGGEHFTTTITFAGRWLTFGSGLHDFLDPVTDTELEIFARLSMRLLAGQFTTPMTYASMQTNIVPRTFDLAVA